MPRPALLAVVVLVVVPLVLLVGLRVARAGALPGTEVVGRDVGGLDGDALRAALATLAASRGEEPLTVQRGDAAVTAPASELGYSLDVEATMDRVLRRGRQLNPLAALADHLRAFGGTTTVEPVQRVDDDRLGEWVADAAEQLELAPVEGTLRFEGDEVIPVAPTPGARVPVERLAAAVRDVLLEPGADTVEATVEPVSPRTTAEDVDAVLAVARRALSAPVRLSRNGTTITFHPVEIARTLRVVVDEDGDDATLRLETDAEAVAGIVTPAQKAAVESEPVSARIEAGGGAVRIIESRDGFRFQPETTAEQLLELATGTGPRDAELAGEVIPPKMTTEQARALNITEVVSSFTTSHKCCQGRVTNIHRIADLVDGAVIRPGQTFSVNDHVGPRTPEKGFVPGGAIYDGEFVDQVGGGVSQFATTLFNAAFFGGYEIPQYKAHSYYISRYPAGRDATLNYPSVDLKITNSSPHGMLIKTSYTSTSITVAIYGTKWVRVEAIDGPRKKETPPPTEYKENPALRPGAQRVVQQGVPGFDIVVTRILHFPDGRTSRKEFFTRYLPQPQIIERNTRSSSGPSPSPSPSPTPSPSASPAG